MNLASVWEEGDDGWQAIPSVYIIKTKFWGTFTWFHLNLAGCCWGREGKSGRERERQPQRLRVIIKTPFEDYPLKGSFLNTQPLHSKKALLFKAAMLMMISDPCGWRTKSVFRQFVCEGKLALLPPRRTATDLSYSSLWSHEERGLFVFGVGDVSLPLPVLRGMKGSVCLVSA